MTKKIDDLDEKIKDAAAKYPFDFEEVFIDGANFMRELMQGEIKSGAMPLELVDRSRELIKKSYEEENQNLREQLAVAIGFLEELYFYDTCTACDNNFDMRDKALSKIKGSAE